MTADTITKASSPESTAAVPLNAARDSLRDEPPLVVDLDGCLVRSDLLIESALALVRRNPAFALSLPLWLLRGKASLKREIAARVDVDVASLPYADDLLLHLKSEHARGRTLILATASHRRYAEAVSANLGVFTDVLATDDGSNLSGVAKGEALAARFGERGFDYAGNSRADLGVWSHARRAILVSAPEDVAQRAAAVAPVAARFDAPRPCLRDYTRALRIHQWLKNLLLFVPLFTAHAWGNLAAASHVLLGFLAFSLCASGIYIVNDLFDLAPDRRHPRKRLRPFAAGLIPLARAILAAGSLLAAGIALAALVNPPFFLCVLTYIAVTLAYSLRLKAYVLIDTMTLAGLYTLRVIAGGAAARIELSFWLLAFSMFLFLSLAMVKRSSELGALAASNRPVAYGRDYRVTDLSTTATMGIASGYIAVLVLALFLQSPDVVRQYSRPWVLWLLFPAILYWVSRMWIKSGRGEMDDDPLVYMIYDRASRLLILAAVAIVLAAL